MIFPFIYFLGMVITAFSLGFASPDTAEEHPGEIIGWSFVWPVTLPIMIILGAVDLGQRLSRKVFKK